MKENVYKLEFQVRDYECDLQGVVNNSVYQNYLEHARHGFLKSKGIDFAELVKQKLNLVVVRIELDYKYPLRSGDNFYVTVQTEQLSKLKCCFNQNIYRSNDDKLILSARVIGTGINERGRPCLPEDLLRKMLDTKDEIAASRCSSQ